MHFLMSLFSQSLFDKGLLKSSVQTVDPMAYKILSLVHNITINITLKSYRDNILQFLQFFIYKE